MESVEPVEKRVENDSASNSSENNGHGTAKKGSLGPLPASKGGRRESSYGSTQLWGVQEDGKRVIQEWECYDKLGYSFPKWKKWLVLSMIFVVQMSMNFNTSVFPSVVEQLAERFQISEQHARVGQMNFLVFYAFGSELWAPWSEEFGRWPIMQLSLGLVNIWQLPCALAPNIGSIFVARALGGLSSAGGSVTLGYVADMFEPAYQQYAVAFIVLSSVGGTSIGPVIGGPIHQYLPWYWNFWVQLIFGGVTQAIHFFTPETRATILMDKEAKRRRKTGEDPNVYGPNELKKPRISLKEIGLVWSRPFYMFVREPIVLCLSLLSGFSDALIFTCIEGFHAVYEQWGFGTLQIAWAFIPINIGYLLAWLSFMPWIRADHKVIAEKGPDGVKPERRLYWLLYMAPLETIGLFGFAWTSLYPQSHWIAPMIFSVLIAIANYSIYMATIDYMVAAYGPYSASATGGNALARDFLAGIAAMYSTPMYENIGDKPIEYASTVLACLAFVVTMPIYVFYFYGPQIRARSKFAQELAADRQETEGRRASQLSGSTFEKDSGQP
ncbi:MAG: hypothetical protein M1831_006022 [Alyxoria varia]|nr:MAG: hypothetical protein M1831_006022 [Alyxoria varia]